MEQPLKELLHGWHGVGIDIPCRTRQLGVFKSKRIGNRHIAGFQHIQPELFECLTTVDPEHMTPLAFGCLIEDIRLNIIFMDICLWIVIGICFAFDLINVLHQGVICLPCERAHFGELRERRTQDAIGTRKVLIDDLILRIYR